MLVVKLNRWNEIFVVCFKLWCYNNYILQLATDLCAYSNRICLRFDKSLAPVCVCVHDETMR